MFDCPRLVSTALVVGATTAIVAAQAGTPAAPQQGPQFKVEIQLVTTDAVVRDAKGQFVADLVRDEFEILEDGVPQALSSMTLVHHGRVTNILAPPPPPPPEGILLPAIQRQDETSGRVFLFVVDDLHLDVKKTPIVRDLFKQAAKNLVHEGDMFAMVSTGTSGIAIDLSYDRKLLEDTAGRISGNGLSATDIIQGASGSQGPIEVRHRAHVAFTAVNQVLTNLEKVRNRRKVVVYVSNGYDFAPFQLARFGTAANSPFQRNAQQALQNTTNAVTSAAQGNAVAQQDPNAVLGNPREGFAEAELVSQMQEVTRTANRANAVIYTIDPRGVDAGADVGDNINPREWRTYIDNTQDTLRVLAAETGGAAIVNENEFDSALKRIDAEASDYYMLGYYSNNPTAGSRERKIEVRAKRPGLTVIARRSYFAKEPAPLEPPAPLPR
jgi:VWFA-related protein